MRILVTNDDGINAPGLKTMLSIAKSLSDDVWVVAPEFERSGSSHSITLTEPLRVRKVSPRRFAVSGTPSDCVLLAVNEIIGPKRPSLILSGVNRGANIADDVTYSGTIAAAMEGTLQQIPSIALSQVFQRSARVPWSTAKKYGPSIVRSLLKVGWPQKVLINVNFPPVMPADVVGVRLTTQGHRSPGTALIHKREDPRGGHYYWLGYRPRIERSGVSTDIWAVTNAYISVTPIKMEFTDNSTRRKLQAVFR